MLKPIGPIKLEDADKYINISIFDVPDNRFVFYDPKIDNQGVIPGRSMEEAEADFERKYGIVPGHPVKEAENTNIE